MSTIFDFVAWMSVMDYWGGGDAMSSLVHQGRSQLGIEFGFDFLASYPLHQDRRMARILNSRPSG